MQQLEHLVDEWVMLSVLSLILNPLPVYMACTINHATQQPCAAPGVSVIAVCTLGLSCLVLCTAGVHGVHHQPRHAAALCRTWGEC
jgi:hypothetical protein